MGTLYVVATPIGNLGDISMRAKTVIDNVSVVFAEDTRITLKLLNVIGVSKRMLSCHANSSDARLQQALAILDDGDAALITDAGTPAISDPGAKLVRLARTAGHIISPIPGPSAVSTALSASGFSADKFTFLGFLPRTAGKRIKVLKSALELQHTLVVFEAPHRITKFLDDLVQLAPDRTICVCRELTKLYEEIFWGLPELAKSHFSNPRGEFVIIIAGDTKKR